jgi:hypothetical protein
LSKINEVFSIGRMADSRCAKKIAVLVLWQLFCLFSFGSPTVTQQQIGLFIRSPDPVLAPAVLATLPKKQTQLSVAMSFDGDGNVREAHVVESSGAPLADEAVRKWIVTRWKVRPEVAKQGVYKGLPLNSTEFTLRMVLKRRSNLGRLF